MLRTILFTIGLTISAVPAAAQLPPPRFTIEAVDRTRTGCELVALDEAGKLSFEEAGARRAVERLVELRQDGRKLPALLTQNFISLTNGDRLPLDADAAAVLADTRLRVWTAAALMGEAKEVSLFAPHVVLLFWTLPEGVDDAGKFFAQLQEEPRKRDVVYLKNGDRIEGSVTALDGKVGCIVATDSRNVQTPWSKLAGIAWNTDRQARLRTKKSYMRAVLEGGAHVNFLELQFQQKSRRWVGKTQFGPTWELPESALLAFDVRQASAVDLSDLVPARYEHRPFLGAAWPLVKDAAASGTSLRLAGNTFEKGLGTHAACQVAYKLDGQYQRLDALVGIDEAALKGRARIAIDLDGKRLDLNDGKEITHQTAPLIVRLDVKGVRTMTLIVDAGSFGDVQAHVNWAKARLIKK
ncbi:MAG: NPCBM/NEW2 domain-containing protein [Planctomycetes bacterium]|nr:NPCBM/NEW2 domain-containing protein [Planctomycetota bacterium]